MPIEADFEQTLKDIFLLLEEHRIAKLAPDRPTVEHLLDQTSPNVLQVAASSFLETSMAFDKTALGNRYTCFECEIKFYDLNKNPVCPSCKADQVENPNPSARDTFLASLSTQGRRKAKKEAAVEKIEKIEEVEEVETDALDNEDEDEEDEEMNAALENELGEDDLGAEEEEEEEEEAP
jgi:hypothetical protein